MAPGRWPQTPTARSWPHTPGGVVSPKCSMSAPPEPHASCAKNYATYSAPPSTTRHAAASTPLSTPPRNSPLRYGICWIPLVCARGRSWSQAAESAHSSPTPPRECALSAWNSTRRAHGSLRHCTHNRRCAMSRSPRPTSPMDRSSRQSVTCRSETSHWMIRYTTPWVCRSTTISSASPSP